MASSELNRALFEENDTQVYGAAEGAEALWLAKLLTARPEESLTLVVRDDAALARTAAALNFFAPKTELLRLPAWDCLPYDRVSPHRDIVAQRLASLIGLKVEVKGQGRVLLTTVNALLQRLPPRRQLWSRVVTVRPGEELAPEHLQKAFADQGYERVETASEPGEYALRGGLVDVFPAGHSAPLRLDFFGDTVESLRTYDPLTQRSTGKAKGLVLLPVSEVRLDEASIERFRQGYRSLFGSGKDDPLYEAVSEGRRYGGLEHWLPLFYETLDRVVDYLPKAAPVILSQDAESHRDDRLNTVNEFYEARRAAMRSRDAGSAPYRPLPPEALYMGPADWDSMLASRPGARLTAFAAPEGREAFDLGARRAPDFSEARQGKEGLYKALAQTWKQAQSDGQRIVIAGSSDGSRDRLGLLLSENGLDRQVTVGNAAALAEAPERALALTSLPLERGFATPELLVLSEQDLLGERLMRAAGKRRKAENFLTEVAALAGGDLVVHVEHGIGRFESLEILDVDAAPHDCLKVVYAGGDRLFVPVENIDVLTRFGGEDAVAELDKLGGAAWQARKAKARERIREIAKSLIRIAAQRQLQTIEPIEPPDGLYAEFAARFPYPETDDQLNAISDVVEDLAAGCPMDRLICGDVGFGKTEVAMRAAFLVAMSGRQVAVVAPTTLLARQHAQVFKERFKGLPVRVDWISRLVAPKQASEVRQALSNGRVDLVVGTHALLAKTTRFRDLGLLIVDEEQHFGVKQKERLKELGSDIHVLTLSATPIPRTLQMAMSGVREMSLIATPPVDRLAVRTFVLPYDPVVLRDAILRERLRGGQIFYVCPRIEDLDEVAERLRKLVPEARFAVAHGQLPPAELERVMGEFLDRRIDILLSTNIVESGLDIPTANTLILHRSDLFGLSQLYQLRGRIGRSKLRAYAYFTLQTGLKLTPRAQRRLEVMQTLDTLGAGFTVATHDLDIRGAGNLVGEEQSGHIKEVGIELYQQMLEEAVQGLKQQKGSEDVLPVEGGGWTPQIKLGVPVLIPEAYVADLNVRMGLYRRLATLVGEAEIEAFAAELIDRFGALPEEVENLLQVMTIKHLCRQAGVAKVDAGPKGAVMSFHQDQPAAPEHLIAYLQSGARDGSVRIRPDRRLVVQGAWGKPKGRLASLRKALLRLVPEATQAAAQ
ncbi:MAG: transcription-repair coupling factor [Rhodospirillales bacterium]|nr:transcription-repair coupling factor [Rhodospirillales bacterium]